MLSAMENGGMRYAIPPYVLSAGFAEAKLVMKSGPLIQFWSEFSGPPVIASY
jgi:hypothetical protein